MNETKEPYKPDTVFCCVTIRPIITLGTTYKVEGWVTHEYGCDPLVVCNDGKTRLMWRGLFHD